MAAARRRASGLGKDGRRIAAHALVYPLRHAGEVVGFTCVIRDVGEKRRAEQTLQ